MSGSDRKSGAEHAHVHGSSGEIDCEKLVELLTDYVDGELPRELHEAIDRHMGSCAPCIAFVREYRFAGESTRRVLIKQVPDGLEERLLSFLKVRCKGS